MTEFLIGAGIAAAFTWLWIAGREPYISANAWNEGYDRGIEQGIAEARDPATAPIRIEMQVR